jgi:SET domain-containing protein
LAGRKRQRIIEYIGPKLSKAKGLAELERGNASLFALDEDDDIDGSVTWNPARFLNHSCVPNCEAGIVRQHIWIYALRRIQAGEELTYNYGLDLGGLRGSSLPLQRFDVRGLHGRRAVFCHDSTSPW